MVLLDDQSSDFSLRVAFDPVRDKYVDPTRQY